LISVPIVVFGSTMVLKLVERFPVIINLGAAVLAFTAASMIIKEPFLGSFFSQEVMKYLTYAFSIAGVLGAGWWATRRTSTTQQEMPTH
jgi:predicted tellurium resistance membrane protein TerC